MGQILNTNVRFPEPGRSYEKMDLTDGKQCLTWCGMTYKEKEVPQKLSLIFPEIRHHYLCLTSNFSTANLITI